MNTVKILLCTFCLGVFSGCNTLQHKESHTAGWSPGQFYMEGNRIYALWDSSNELQDLIQAASNYAEAYSLQTQNTQYQYAHYLAQFQSSFWLLRDNEEDLLALYKKLAPDVQREVPPPARIGYLYKKVSGEDASSTIPPLKRAILQKPQDALSWRQLSNAYAENSQTWLALASAQTAYKLQPESASAAYLMGQAFKGLAEEHACSDEGFSRLKRSAFYLAKAAALEENSQYYQASGESFVRLGIQPLAYLQLQKALSSGKGKQNPSLLIDVTSLQGKLEEATKMAQDAYQQDKNPVQLEQLAKLEAKAGNWPSAVKYLHDRERKHQLELTLADKTVSTLIQAISQGKPFDKVDFSFTQAENNYTRKALRYLEEPNSENRKQLLKLSSNSCLKSRTWLYMAAANWQKNDPHKTLKYLALAKKGKTPYLPERVWADAIHQGLSERKHF